VAGHAGNQQEMQHEMQHEGPYPSSRRRDGTFNLYVIGADGKGLRQLTHEKPGVEAGMQSWTADGKWIWFGLFGKGPPRMCRIAPDGSNFQVIASGIDPAVSPDGKTVVFARQMPDGHRLFAMNADGSNVRQLTNQGNPFAGVHAAWSPDGKMIVYADRVGEALEIFRIDPDGKNARQLTRLGKAATTPAVSPDLKWISFRLCDEIYWREGKTSARAYRERRADKRPVWVMGIDGSDPHVIEPLHYQTTIDGSRAPLEAEVTHLPSRRQPQRGRGSLRRGRRRWPTGRPQLQDGRQEDECRQHRTADAERQDQAQPRQAALAGDH
jgi:TolB protein